MDNEAKEEIKRVVKAFRDWSNGVEIPDKDIGICGNLEIFLGLTNSNYNYYKTLVIDNLKSFYTSWEHYSGNSTFPVEGSLIDYCASINDNSLWNDKRKDLAKHLANKFEELLK